MWLEDARNANDLIISTEQQEMNENIINEIYLNYLELGLDAINEDNRAAIEELALQCPFIGGSAVYKARMLHALFAPPTR